MNRDDLRRAHLIIPPTLRETVTHIATATGTETSTTAWWKPPNESEWASSGIAIIGDMREWCIPLLSGVTPTVGDKVRNSDNEVWIVQSFREGLLGSEFKCLCSTVKT